jgi:hypothetical protein
MKKIFMLFTVIPEFFSCITDPPVIPFTQAEVAGTYKINGFYAVDQATQQYYMIYDSLPLCQKAVLIKLNKDSTYTHIANDSSCTSLTPFRESGKWHVNEINAKQTFAIDSLSCDIYGYDGKIFAFWYPGNYMGHTVLFNQTLVKQ